MTKKTILLVEDNPNDVELTRMAFENNNISNNLIVAKDGQEAIDYLFNSGKYAGKNNNLPQLILLDLNLPKLNGLEVLKKVRNDDRTKHMPVIILTSSVEERDLLEAYEHNTNAYVKKPVDFNQFVEAVKTLGLFWIVLNETPSCGIAGK